MPCTATIGEFSCGCLARVLILTRKRPLCQSGATCYDPPTFCTREETTMKSRLLLSVAAFALLLAAAAVAADATGKWTADVPGRGGNTVQTTFVFKVEGDKLTGTVTTQQG